MRQLPIVTLREMKRYSPTAARYSVRVAWPGTTPVDIVDIVASSGAYDYVGGPIEDGFRVSVVVRAEETYVIVEAHHLSDSGYNRTRRARVFRCATFGGRFEATRNVDIRSLLEGDVHEVARNGWVDTTLPLELEPA